MVPLPPGERESWAAISGIVVLVILVVLLLALLLLYRRRQKDKQNNTPTVSFSTSRTVNSEYAVPGTVQREYLPGLTVCTGPHSTFKLDLLFTCPVFSFEDKQMVFHDSCFLLLNTRPPFIHDKLCSCGCRGYTDNYLLSGCTLY